MKRIALMGAVMIIALSVFYSCQKTVSNPQVQKEQITENELQIAGKPTSNCYDYQITMTRTFQDGKTQFVWKIVNPVPGNGSNGTQKDLSHWGFKPQCIGGADLNYYPQDILAAYYSYNNNTNWVQIVPTPKITKDPSSSCMLPGEETFKFDYGTRGSQPTYYKLVLNGNWAAADEGGNGGFVKTGKSCCRLSSIPGVGCKQLQ